jgi:hypothetical protein
MSDKKILSIDPNMFSFSNNTTRKKKSSKPTEPKIKMKPRTKPVNNASIKKRSIINMMRQHQADKYKKTFDTTNPEPPKKMDVTNFNNDFSVAKDYFNNLKETVKKNTNNLQHTVKQTPTFINSMTTNNIPAVLNTNNLTNIADNIRSKVTDPVVNINPNIQPLPKYGCLKNGLLPTYRTLMNQTRKHLPDMTGGGGIESAPITNSNVLNTSNELVNKSIQKQQIDTKLANINKNKLKYRKKKQKKTIRRTFKTGRSSIMPKVSVLVSNKTIRNNISTKTLLMKQTPIYEVRKYLIKHGFIKVGAVTPNDVLRKMYETAMLICGEIQNHNPDNLLYNFLHDTETY